MNKTIKKIKKKMECKKKHCKTISKKIRKTLNLYTKAYGFNKNLIKLSKKNKDVKKLKKLNKKYKTLKKKYNKCLKKFNCI